MSKFTAVQWDGHSGTANEWFGEAYMEDWEYTAPNQSSIFLKLANGTDAIVEVGDYVFIDDNGNTITVIDKDNVRVS